jgi:hypothetical protein
MYYARRKGQDIPIGDGVIKQIEDTVRIRLLCFNYSLVRSMASMRENLQTLSEYTRL